jgi:FtsZ-binding cell division protein ZapB
MNDTEIMEAFNEIAEKIVEAIEANTLQQIEISSKLERIIAAIIRT